RFSWTRSQRNAGRFPTRFSLVSEADSRAFIFTGNPTPSRRATTHDSVTPIRRRPVCTRTGRVDQLMRRISWVGRLMGGIGILVMVSGCTDRLPTLTDPNRFPGGEIPVTFEHVIEAEDFLLGSSVFDGITD